MTIDRLRLALDGFESAAVGLVAKAATWAAPLPTAWLVYDRTLAHFAWPPWVAFVAGAVIEALGLAVAVTGLTLWTYNRERTRKGDPAAPMRLPVALGVLYLVSAELLIVVLDVAPKWPDIQAADLAPGIFPLLTVAAVSVIALRIDHARRLADIAAVVSGRKGDKVEREERHHRREMERLAAEARYMSAEAKLLTAQGAVTTGQPEPATAEGPVTLEPSPVIARSFADFARAASAGELEPATMTGEQVAEWAGKSDSTGRRWKQKWGNGNHAD